MEKLDDKTGGQNPDDTGRFLFEGMKDKTYKETLEEIIEHETKIMRSKKKQERTENTLKAYVKKLRESA